MRLAVGGAQALQGVVPDLTAMGKIIGGGFYGGGGGRSSRLPVGGDRSTGAEVIHSGTFNGNPVSACARVVSVRELTAERIERMDRLAERLAARLVGAAAAWAGCRSRCVARDRCCSASAASGARRQRHRSDADLATARCTWRR
ncbi:MAG: hypothetical protein R2755_04770 [Acidimicrobiales bacterium]